MDFIQYHTFSLVIGVPSVKRKASLEEAFTIADTAYEPHKKQRRSEESEVDKISFCEKKKSKDQLPEVKLAPEKKQSNKKLDQKEVDKDKQNTKWDRKTSEIRSENVGSSSVDPKNRHILRRDKKQDRKHEKKKKSTEQPKRISKPSSASDSVQVMISILLIQQVIHSCSFSHTVS